MDGLLPILAQTPEELSSAQAFAIFTALLVVLVAIFLFYIIPMFFIYKKAGKPAWAAIVPVYNTYVLGQIIGRNPLLMIFIPIGLVILTFVPIVNLMTGLISFVFSAIIAYDIAIVFGQSQGLAIANIFFSPFINFYLAFSNNAQYQGPLAGADQRVLLQSPWLDPDLGVQAINPYAPQVYGATGQYNPNAAGSYQPMGYNPTGAPTPGQPPLGNQPGMPAQPPVTGQSGMPPQSAMPGAPTFTPQPGMPTMPPAQPSASGSGNGGTSAADWGPAPEAFSQPPAAPAPEAPPAVPTDEGNTQNPFGPQ